LARKILLADDSVTAQNMGRKILTDAGYEVITVNNGSAALKKIADSRPDLAVLDVYMPGYSGLEVCQRIKENSETSHLPVLLTVGKLEPFKQDEARRVRADAFIIKPFEATELLAVLGKLEDKLVAPGPTKVSKSAPNTMETFERQARDGGPKYGDEDSGWKARLKIPADGPKVTENEAPNAIAAPFHDLRNTNSASAAAISLLDLPKDITPDEVAALAAAMSRVKSGNTESAGAEAISDGAAEKDAKADTSATHAAGEVAAKIRSDSETLPEPTTFAQIETATDDAGVTEQFAASARESVTEMSAEGGEIAKAEQVTTSEEVVAVADGTGSGTDEPGVAISEQSSAAQSIEGTAEVTPMATASPAEIEAAISSITLTNSETAATGVAGSSNDSAIAASAAAAQVAGPRWIAEEVPVEAAESVLVLEREMQKAYAAFAAAEHAASFYRYESAPIDRDDEPAFAMAPVPIGTPVPSVEMASANIAEESQLESAQLTGSDLNFRALAASDLPKPPAPPFAAAASAAGGDSGIAAFGTPQPFGAESRVDTMTAELSADVAGSVAPQSGPALGGKERTEASAVSEAQREAEISAATAAAWASWRDIRESLVNAKNASESDTANREEGARDGHSTEGRPPEDPAAELELIKQLRGLASDPTSPIRPVSEAAKSPAASANADSAQSGNPNEIASIVDSMLAELRPKLVAEIAKKLGKKD